MADYDWFSKSDSDLRAEGEHRQWLIDNNLIEIPSDDIHSQRKKIGCTLCGCRLISKGYVEVHRKRCFVSDDSEGKHKA